VPEGREWIAGLPDELSGQRKIMLSLLDWSEADERVGWLVVACSVGRGNADRLSDLDMGLAIDVPEADFDAAVADVHQAVDQAGDLIESYHHKLPGVPFTHERIFAQYADRCQVDLVVIPLAQDYGPVKDEVVLYGPGERRTAVFEPRPVTPVQVREWAFNGWACLADVGKYLRRGSAWEALERLHQARNECWRLLATAADVPNPQFGVTSLLDFSAKPLPAELAATASALDLAGLLAAALALADQLTEVGQALTPELSAALPDAMADYITADLAVLAETGPAETGPAETN
jgi:hypothetical protein